VAELKSRPAITFTSTHMVEKPTVPSTRASSPPTRRTGADRHYMQKEIFEQPVRWAKHLWKW